MVDETFPTVSPIQPLENHSGITSIVVMVFKIDPYLSMP
jgi:hypothetical protein